MCSYYCAGMPRKILPQHCTACFCRATYGIWWAANLGHVVFVLTELGQRLEEMAV